MFSAIVKKVFLGASREMLVFKASALPPALAERAARFRSV
jgi:hypothetical protein